MAALDIAVGNNTAVQQHRDWVGQDRIVIARKNHRVPSVSFPFLGPFLAGASLGVTRQNL
jgi:hypothetical protein